MKHPLRLLRLSLLSLLVLAGSSPAGDVKVTGFVRDRAGNPLPGALVALASVTEYQSVTSDADGAYTLAISYPDDDRRLSLTASMEQPAMNRQVLCFGPPDDGKVVLNLFLTGKDEAVTPLRDGRERRVPDREMPPRVKPIRPERPAPEPAEPQPPSVTPKPAPGSGPRIIPRPTSPPSGGVPRIQPVAPPGTKGG